MLFWNSLWKNDHAITYLSEKHLSTAHRKTWSSLPKWVKVLTLCSAFLLALMGLFSASQMVIEEGLRGLLISGLACLFLGMYGTVFWGAYRSWTLGSLLSKLRQGESLQTFLYTSVDLEDTVDVLAARTFRQMMAFMAFPFGALSLIMVAYLPGVYPWQILIMLSMVVGYFAILGAYGLIAVHAATGDSAPKAVGKGLFICFLSLYGPLAVLVLSDVVLPGTGDILGVFFALYFLYLPILFRNLAVHWLREEPSCQERGLVARVKSVLPKVSGAFFFKRLADQNPVLARNLSSQNLLLPVGVVLGLLVISSHMSNPSGPGFPRVGQLAWLEVHIVSWLTAVALSGAAFLNSSSAVSQEERSGSLDLLRSTPLPARAVVDAWAIAASWAYLIAALSLMFWQLPGQWEALAFTLSLPICAAYGGIVSGLKDTPGSWIWVGVAGMIFFSWMALPGAFMVGVVHAHALLAAVLLGAAWYLRRRALLAYGG